MICLCFVSFKVSFAGEIFLSEVLCVYGCVCLGEDGMQQQHLSQGRCYSSSVIVTSVCLGEASEFIFIKSLWDGVGKLDYAAGEPRHKHAASHSHRGTCLTDKCRPSSLRNLRIPGKPARILACTHLGITTAARQNWVAATGGQSQTVSPDVPILVPFFNFGRSSRLRWGCVLLGCPLHAGISIELGTEPSGPSARELRGFVALSSPTSGGCWGRAGGAGQGPAPLGAAFPQGALPRAPASGSGRLRAGGAPGAPARLLPLSSFPSLLSSLRPLPSAVEPPGSLASLHMGLAPPEGQRFCPAASRWERAEAGR